MQRIFLLFGFLLTTSFVQGQGDYLISGKSFIELQKEDQKLLESEILTISFRPLQSKNIAAKSNYPSLEQQFLNPYAVEDLTFFCRLEVKIEKKLRMPFKFRLGEVQYTERMEGKY